MKQSAMLNSQVEAGSSRAASAVKGRSGALKQFVEECMMNSHSLAMICLCAIMSSIWN
jgi:hypothetical protein